jgi:hypothetical protein
MNSDLPIDSGVYSIVSMKQLASLENLGDWKMMLFWALGGSERGWGEVLLHGCWGDGRHCR